MEDWVTSLGEKWHRDRTLSNAKVYGSPKEREQCGDQAPHRLQ